VEIAPIDKWGHVKSAYEDAKEGQPITGTKRVNFTQHCEITLALEMLNRLTRREFVKKQSIGIGVSKASCEWCCQYLELLSREYRQYPVLVRASHGKQPDGWLMPPSGPTSVTKDMAKAIVDKVDDAVWEIESHRKSDSNELPDIQDLFTLDADEADPWEEDVAGLKKETSDDVEK
jgi:hypothetical protein